MEFLGLLTVVQVEQVVLEVMLELVALVVLAEMDRRVC